MSDLDVIIPVHNEADNVEELFLRLDKSFSGTNIDYRAIFIDDYSTDETVEKIGKLSNGLRFRETSGLEGKENFTKKDETADLGNTIYDATNGDGHNTNGHITNGSKIKLLFKKGKKGKAYSILEAVKVARSPYIAMIDGDLQYPPEAIPEMYKRVLKNGGVIVANRKKHDTSRLRKFGSYANALFLEKLLLGMDCDAQSGLKIFKKEIIENLSNNEITPWTLDMPLLAKAKEMGHHVDTLDIDFSERKKGKSKVNFIKTSLEIALSALKLKFKKAKFHTIKTKDGQAIGSGVVHKGRRYITHTNLPHAISAIETLIPWQKFTLLSLFMAVILGILVVPVYTLIVLLAFLTLIYFFDLIFSFHTVRSNLNFENEIRIDQKEIQTLNDRNLPVYTILSPLYKEAKVLGQFVSAIEALDWPKDKLDVILLMEEDDHETIEIASTLSLPEYFRIIVVPDTSPKTKPKACNYGLSFAKGEYLVIYDAEDKPDPLQLKKAYLGFKKVGGNVVCLQSKLNYYNHDQNLITKLFTAEYCLWFDLILPGLTSIQTTIPLGGTSNHFKIKALRYLEGWDAFNVTEDCDLGARLFKAGFRTGILDSTTYEEANSKLGSWLRQRSRWIKGYMQTYFVHMRNPYDFVKKHGFHALIFQLVIGMRMTFMIINPFLWLTTISYFLARGVVGDTIESLFPPLIFYLANTTMILGNFMYFYNYMIGCAKRGRWELVKYVLFVPFYWVLTSIAAFKAFYQLVFRPYYWEKTEHGLHLTEAKTKWLPAINLTFEFDKTLNFGFVDKILKLFVLPPISLAKNVVDVIDIVWPLPKNDRVKNGALRILIFNWRDTKHMWSGGAEVYVHELAKRWVAWGHKVTLFCGWDGKSRRNEVVDGVEVIRRGGFFTVYFFAAIYYLLRLRTKYDILVESENGIPFFTPLYSRLPKLLIIHHVHQEVFRRYLLSPLAKLASFIESEITPYVYKDQRIITVSESTKADLLNLYRGTSEKIDIVNPGVNIPPAKWTKTKTPSLLYLGRLKPYKNINIAIEAFSGVSKKYAEATLTIAGFGEIINDLKKQVKRLNLNDKVKILGKVTDEEKLKLLAESWVAIQPSSFEGWGITVLEANACETAVIASNVPGLRDSVRDGVTGILVPVKDVSSLTSAMVKLIEDKNLRETLSENAKLWSEKFNWDLCAQRFLEIAGGLRGKSVLPAGAMARRRVSGESPEVAEAISN